MSLWHQNYGVRNLYKTTTFCENGRKYFADFQEKILLFIIFAELFGNWALFATWPTHDLIYCQIRSELLLFQVIMTKNYWFSCKMTIFSSVSWNFSTWNRCNWFKWLYEVRKSEGEYVCVCVWGRLRVEEKWIDR